MLYFFFYKCEEKYWLIHVLKVLLDSVSTADIEISTMRLCFMKQSVEGFLFKNSSVRSSASLQLFQGCLFLVRSTDCPWQKTSGSTVIQHTSIKLCLFWACLLSIFHEHFGFFLFQHRLDQLVGKGIFHFQLLQHYIHKVTAGYCWGWFKQYFIHLSSHIYVA